MYRRRTGLVGRPLEVRLVLIVAQVVVVSPGPLRLLDRATRKLVKRLAQKLRADEPEMHPLAVTTGIRSSGMPAQTNLLANVC